MPGKSSKTNAAASGTCFDDDLLYRYLEKMMTQEEKERIEQHLNECNACFADVTALTEIIEAPITEAERIEIARSRKTLPDEQVQKILDQLKEQEGIWTRLRDGVMNLVQGLGAFISNMVVWLIGKRMPVGRVVFGVATLLIVFAGSFGTLQYYNKGYRIGEAERLLKENFSISIAGVPRLAGDYLPTGMSVPMAAGERAEKEKPYLTKALTLTKEAIANGYKSPRARQLLAQIYIIQGNVVQADSLLKQILKTSPTAAAALNDVGVIYFRNKELQTAAQYFAAAIQADPHCKEARYNLALAQAEMGNREEAIANLKEYISLETIEGWKNAALRFKDQLQKDGGE